MLGHALGEPHGHDCGHHRVRGQHIRITEQHVRTILLALVPKVLQVERRHPLGGLAGRAQRDDVDEFVGNHVAQPVRTAAQIKVVVQGSGPDLDGIVVVEGRAVGVVVVVLQQDAHPAPGLIFVEFRHRTVRVLGNPGGPRRRPFQTLVVEDTEVLGLQHLPVQFRVVLGLGRGDLDREEEQENAAHRLTAILTIATAR